VLRVTHSGSSPTEVRIAINLDQWIEGYIVTLGILGDALQVKQAVKASAFAAGPQTLADYSFSFQLAERPTELLAFAVVLQGQAFDRIMSLSCSQATQSVKPPPSPPPPPPLAVAHSGSTGRASSASNLDSYGHIPGVEYSESNADGSYGEALPTPTPQSSSPSRGHKAGGGGGSVTLLLFAICALGVAGFFARKQGMLDSLLRPRAAIRVDGSEEKVGIVDAVEAGVAGCDGLHPAEESPSSKGQDRPLM